MHKPQTIKEIFTSFFEENHWKHPETVSGKGSSIFNAKYLIDRLPFIIQALNIRSLLDAPCGDHNFMKEIDLTKVKYTGVDIVDALINENKQKYESNNK